jgi:cyanophycinase
MSSILKQTFRCYVTSFLLVCLTVQLAATDSAHIDPTGAPGKLVIGGGGILPPVVRQVFVGWAGGKDARLVIVPTASIQADDAAASAAILQDWQDEEIADAVLMHTRSRDEANSAEFVAVLEKATGVWFVGGSQQKLADAYVGTLFEERVLALLGRGGVVGGSSAGAAIQSRMMIQSGKTEANIGQGFDLLPGTIIDQHFSARNRLTRLMSAVDKNPLKVGLGIDEQTALLVAGRMMRVVGVGKVTVCYGKSDKYGLESQQKTYAHGTALDLTSLRRVARSRQAEPFPPKKTPAIEVKRGALMIVGGGGMPLELVKEFVKLAGGDDAKIVVLPTAMPDPLPGTTGQRMFAAVGVTDVTVLVQRKLEDVESREMLQALKNATGVWFGGGRQWRFVDAYEHTKAYPLIFAVLKRGGVIGGSSAGASIQGDYLARGNPLGNLDIMAAGYERGFGFLPGVAIDQHFAQRNRFADMASLVKRYPQVLGIGIDEATALIVKGSVAEVRGPGKVHFFDRSSDAVKTDLGYLSVPSGKAFDLDKRSVLEREN